MQKAIDPLDPSMTQVTSASSEFARAWSVVLVAAVGFGLGVSALPFYTAGLFVKELEAQFGWTRAVASSAPIALALGVALGAPLAGRLADRIGARLVALISSVALAASFAFLSRTPGSVAAFIGTVFAMGLLGAGSSSVTYTRVINSWFSSGRGLALGITLMGAGFAGALAPLSIAPVIANYGWRQGYLVLATAALISAPLVLLMRERGAVANSDATNASAKSMSLAAVLSQRRFWLLLATAAFMTLGNAGLLIHLVPLLTDRGLSSFEAAKVASSIGFAVIAARLMIGLALDRFFAPLVGAVVALLTALGCLLLQYGGASWTVVAALTLGFTLGAEIDLLAYLTARYFGLSAYGQIYGVIYAVTLLAAGVAPLGVGLAFDHFGDYTAAILVSAASLAISGVLLLLMGRYPVAEASRS